MNGNVTLEAFLRRASRIAEDLFDKVGELEMIWLVENAAGEQEMIVTPVNAPSAVAAAEYKENLSAAMRDLFRERGIVRYAVAAEAWSAKGAVDPYRSLSDHPQRFEIVFITAEDVAGAALLATREIVRPAGGRPYLGRLEICDGGSVGRFVNLLTENVARH
jgi:hypothetical protein